MIYGLYLSAQGAKNESLRQDVIANNLANASTNAFKRDLAIFQANQPFDVANGNEEQIPGNLNLMTGGVSPAGTVTDFSNGSLVATGGKFDLALAGPGFLHVTDGQQELLTRDGRLTVNGNNKLVTQNSGHEILGIDGAPIEISSNIQDVEIHNDGTIIEITDTGARENAGRIDLVRIEFYDRLEKVGNGFYKANENLQAAGEELKLKQGFLEESGTNPVVEMMGMIESSRAFEANVNMIQSQDEALGQLLQSIPRR